MIAIKNRSNSSNKNQLNNETIFLLLKCTKKGELTQGSLH